MKRRLFLSIASVPLLTSTGWTDAAITPSRPQISPRDAAVLEVVLTDLLSTADSPLEHFGNGPKALLFAAAPSAGPFPSGSALEAFRSKDADPLIDAQQQRLREAAAAVEKRDKEPDPFNGFAPKERRIKLYTREQDTKDKESLKTGRTLRRPQVFRAFPPGYATDNTLALVNLWFPWSIHHGEAYYVLARRGEEWKVLKRKFVYYP